MPASSVAGDPRIWREVLSRWFGTTNLPLFRERASVRALTAPWTDGGLGYSAWIERHWACGQPGLRPGALVVLVHVVLTLPLPKIVYCLVFTGGPSRRIWSRAVVFTQKVMFLRIHERTMGE